MPKPERPYKRRIVLIRPAMQMRMMAPFVAITAVALLLQFVVAKLGEGDPLTMAIVLSVIMGVLLPVAVGVGVLVTFRVAGPVYRFEQHLGAIARGEDPGECRIRKTDELHDLCAAINAAVGRLRDEIREARESNGAAAAATAVDEPAETPVESLV